MDELQLPTRLIAPGEELWGDRVNVYQKTEIVKVLTDALNPEEISFLRSSCLSKLLDLPSLPAWSGTFGIFLMSRQLVTRKENEMWVIFAGWPIRFSLREFKIVTGLPCGKFPPTDKKKRKGKGKSVEEESYFTKLFDTDRDDVTVDKVLFMLKEKVVTDYEIRLRLACLVLVDGILVPTTNFPRSKILVEHAEMVEDLTSFLSYPWGRVSFDMIMNSVKERDVKSLATSNVAVQGFFQALQLVVIDAVPELQRGLTISSCPPASSSAVGVIQNKRPICPFNVNFARVVDIECKVQVDPIIRPEIVFDPETEDLSWSDDEEDPRVEQMLDLISAGYRFTNDDFSGSCKLSELSCHPRQRRRNKAIAGRCRASKLNGHPVHGGRTGSRPRVGRSDEGGSSGNGLGLSSDLRNLLESMFEEQERNLVRKYSEVISSKLADNNSLMLESLKKWISLTFVIDEQPNAQIPKPTCTTQTTEATNFNHDNSTSPNDHQTNTIYGQMSVNEIYRHYASKGDEDLGTETGVVNSPPHPANMSVNTQQEKETSGFDAGIDVEHQSDSDESASQDEPVSEGDDEASTEPSAEGVDHTEVHLSDTNPAECLMEVDATVEIDDSMPEKDVDQPPDHTDVRPMGQLDEEKSEGVVLAIVPKPHVPLRKSKRARVVSTKFGSQFQYDKRMRRNLTNIPEQSQLQTVNASDEETVFSRINSLKGTIKLGISMTLSARELNELLSFKKSPPAKVMDALIKFTRHILRSDIVDDNPLRVDVLDSKFVSLLCRLYPKFAKADNRDEFVFPSSLVEIVEGHGDVDRVHFYTEADMLYVPFNFDQQHWVALAVDLKAGAIHVLDSNFSLRNDFGVTRDIQPFAAMLPYLFRQVSTNLEMSQVELKQFTIERILGVPQVLATAQSGLMTIFLIQAHASGGLAAVKELDVADLESESKKLVVSLIDTFSG